MPRRKKRQPYKPPVMRGDHGTGTQAALANKELVPVLTEDGRNPNNVYQRREVIQIELLKSQQRLDQSQVQAAQAIQDAHSRVEMLSSGGPLKERVQASPKPDATIDVQVDAISRRKHLMDPIPRGMAYVVEHVCWHNKPLSELGPEHVHLGILRRALSAVAEKRRV